MNNNKTYIIISIGILFGALFPIGVYTLIFKILERILFNTSLNTFLASGTSAYTAAIISILSFSLMMEYLITNDYSKVSQVKKVFCVGIIVNILIHLLWFFIPFIDGYLGLEYMNTINQAYELLASDLVFGHLITNISGQLVTFIGIVYLMYKRITRFNIDES